MKTGKLYIISAPSGAGKTSLVKQLLIDLDKLTVSISHTTRSMRVGEKHGKDYYFVELDEYKKMIADHAFLEHAQVFDNYYGTARQSVESFLEKGIDVILEIDWQGAQQVRNIISESSSIFILPPSIEVLRKRLEDRGQDSKQVIERRMGDAINEMGHCKDFDYLVINDDFTQALTELKSIIICQRLERKRQLENRASLVETLIYQHETYHSSQS